MVIRRLLRLALAILLFAIAMESPAQKKEAPEISAAQLLDPEMFPDAQYRMQVSKAELAGGRGSVVATGGTFEIDSETDIEHIQHQQRNGRA